MDGTIGMRERHGCVTAYLVFVLVANAITSLVYVFMSDAILRNLPQAEDWMIPILIVGSLLNVVFAVALLRWKKWGFFGFAALGAMIFVLNMMAGLGAQSLAGLVGIGILWVVLQVAKEGQPKAWELME